MRVGIMRPAHGDGSETRLVAAATVGSPLVDLRRAAMHELIDRGATTDRAGALAAAAFPGSLTGMLSGGSTVTEWARRLASAAPDTALLDTESVRLGCPVDPPAFRDFMSFDEHVRNTYAPSGHPPPEVLYQLPAYYKGSTATLIGPDDQVPWPHYAGELDYELEYAIVVGRAGVDLTPEQALPHVFGVTVLNDFSDRRMQFVEMRSRLGPAKGKDFATALGPWVVTLDEVMVHELAMNVAVNTRPIAAASSGDAMWRAEELVAWASAAEPLRPGEVIGSGTVGGGSGLEQGVSLTSGDTVELTIEGIGSLRNTIGPRPEAGYRPQPKQRS